MCAVLKTSRTILNESLRLRFAMAAWIYAIGHFILTVKKTSELHNCSHHYASNSVPKRSRIWFDNNVLSVYNYATRRCSLWYYQ